MHLDLDVHSHYCFQACWEEIGMLIFKWESEYLTKCYFSQLELSISRSIFLFSRAEKNPIFRVREGRKSSENCAKFCGSEKFSLSFSLLFCKDYRQHLSVYEPDLELHALPLKKYLYCCPYYYRP